MAAGKKTHRLGNSDEVGEMAILSIGEKLWVRGAAITTGGWASGEEFAMGTIAIKTRTAPNSHG